MDSGSAPSLLLALPDACLQQVLQYCSTDQRSLLSAARAHSRLHHAAVQILRSINAIMTQQQQRDSALLYMHKHSHHVQDMVLKGGEPHHILSLAQLPPLLQLNSLQLSGLCLGSKALQDAARITSLQQLRLSDCKLLNPAALAAALPQLPAGLEHLSIRNVTTTAKRLVKIPPTVLASLQQLTYLELVMVQLAGCEDIEEASPALQPLQALTRLADLRLISVEAEITTLSNQCVSYAKIPASVLSGAQGLTRLELNLTDWAEVEADVLAGKTLLQHLNLNRCCISAGDMDDPQGDSDSVLLSYLQHMQHLTHLSLEHNLLNLWVLPNDSSDEEEEQQQEEEVWSVCPPPEAYAALTASSTLRHLDITMCRMPAGAWQHILPTGRQLPHLTELNISHVQYPRSGPLGLGMLTVPPGVGTLPSGVGTLLTLPPLEGSRLVSCCPSLRVLDMQHCRFSTGLLIALQGLTRLVRLKVGHYEHNEESRQSLEAVCQLTGLRELGVLCPNEEGLLLRLTELKQLTRLEYEGITNDYYDGCVILTNRAPGDEPVWRQVLRHYLDHSDPAVVQQAAAALREWQHIASSSSARGHEDMSPSAVRHGA